MRGGWETGEVPGAPRTWSVRRSNGTTLFSIVMAGLDPATQQAMPIQQGWDRDAARTHCRLRGASGRHGRVNPAMTAGRLCVHLNATPLAFQDAPDHLPASLSTGAGSRVGRPAALMATTTSSAVTRRVS